MIQKSKTLIFSTAFLIMSTLSAHAMENVKEVKEQKTRQKRTKSQRPERSEKYSNKVYRSIPEKPIELNQFGVPPFEYEGAILFYSKRINQGNFTPLFNLFTKIPVEKRSSALKDLEREINLRNFRPMFSKYHCLPGNIVTDSPTKPKNALSLEDWLLQLPDEDGKRL